MGVIINSSTILNGHYNIGIANRLLAPLLFSTVLVVVLMTSYLEHVKVPLPAWTRDKGCHVSPYPVFHVYAVCILELLFIYPLVHDSASEITPYKFWLIITMDIAQ